MAGKPFKDKGLEVKSLDRSSHGIASAIWIDKLGPSRGARGGDPPPPGEEPCPQRPAAGHRLCLGGGKRTCYSGCFSWTPSIRSTHVGHVCTFWPEFQASVLRRQGQGLGATFPLLPALGSSPAIWGEKVPGRTW